MIIAIGGLTGSGKNTLGERLARRLGYAHVCPTFKDIAEKEGIPLMELQKKAEKDPNIDLKFDEILQEKVKKGNCVVTTWLGPWVIDADVRIWIYATETVRASRIKDRDKMSEKEALKHLKERDDNNRKRYQKLYKIDIDDHSEFDCSLNSGIYRPEQLEGIVMKIIETKRR